MNKLLGIAQIIVSGFLIISILLQQRGAGGSIVTGGTDTSYYAKRGLEKVLFVITIISAFLFLAIAFVNLLI